MGLDNFTNQHDRMVSFLELPGVFFTEMSGGRVQNDTTLQHPGGFGHPVVIDGPSTVDQITLRKPYDAVRDIPLLAWDANWTRGIRLPLTLKVQPVTSAGAPLPSGKPEIYRGCHRVSFSTPDVSKGGAETAMLEVVVQPETKE